MISKNYEKVRINIYVLSHLSLQTDFMLYAIENRLNARCIVFDQEIDKFPDDLLKRGDYDLTEFDSSLILIDREIHRFKSIIREVSNNHHCMNSKIVLYNINEKTKIEKNLLSKQIRGFFNKDEHIDTFIKGIEAIWNNEVWISREILLQYVFEDFRVRKFEFEKSNNLTKREIEILTLVSMGSTNDEIADKIFVSTNTVKTHLYNIFKKIDVQNRIQAALWAAKKL